MSPRAVLVVIFAAAAVACGGEEPNFSLEGATVDDVYWCPSGARDAPYDLHATVEARNGTARAVAFAAATAELELVSVVGPWLEKVGDRYDAGTVRVTPNSIAPHASATLSITIRSACSSGRWGPRTGSSGSYRVSVRLVTSAGEIRVTATNEHRILAA